MRAPPPGHWPNDPNIHRAGKGGLPPDGHPRRCQHYRAKSTTEQCPFWAVKGRRFCVCHGGRTRLGRVESMPNFYGRYAGPTLAAKLKEIHDNTDPEKRQSLVDEIDMARELCGRSVAMYDAVFENPDNAGKDISPEVKARVLASVRNSLTHVSELVAKFHKMEYDKKNTIPATWIDYYVLKLTQVIYRKLGKIVPEDNMREVIEEMKMLPLPKAEDINPRVVLELEE